MITGKNLFDESGRGRQDEKGSPSAARPKACMGDRPSRHNACKARPQAHGRIRARHTPCARFEQLHRFEAERGEGGKTPQDARDGEQAHMVAPRKRSFEQGGQHSDDEASKHIRNERSDGKSSEKRLGRKRRNGKSDHITAHRTQRASEGHRTQFQHPCLLARIRTRQQAARLGAIQPIGGRIHTDERTPRAVAICVTSFFEM